MPVYRYEIEVGRKLTEPEKQELRDVVTRAWAGMQRTGERNAALATTMHARHLTRIELWATHPKGHRKAGQDVHNDAARSSHLFCSDCTRTLVGYGAGGGLACPEVARHPEAAAKACHPTCVIECGERPLDTQGAR